MAGLETHSSWPELLASLLPPSTVRPGCKTLDFPNHLTGIRDQVTYLWLANKQKTTRKNLLSWIRRLRIVKRTPFHVTSNLNKWRIFKFYLGFLHLCLMDSRHLIMLIFFPDYAYFLFKVGLLQMNAFLQDNLTWLIAAY